MSLHSQRKSSSPHDIYDISMIYKGGIVQSRQVYSMPKITALLICIEVSKFAKALPQVRGTD